MRMVEAEGSGRAEAGVDAESEAMRCERKPPEKSSEARAELPARIAKIAFENRKWKLGMDDNVRSEAFPRNLQA